MFEKHLRDNKLRTWFLLLTSVVLLGVALSAAWALLGLDIIFLAIAMFFAVVSPWILYYNSAKIVVHATGAQPATEEGFKQLHNIVEEVCLASGMPKPKLMYIEDGAPNAFATGRNQNNAVVAVTTGLMEKMNREQLQSVIAHEMAHIANKDMLVSTLAATISGMIIIIANIGLRLSLFARSGRNVHPLIVVVALVGLIAAPIGAALLKAGISRRREQLADYSAAKMLRNPAGMRSALEVLQGDHTSLRKVSLSTSHLWIDDPNPEGGKEANWMHKMFSTHPPIAERIQAMKELEMKGI
jgi:heat shock protein HtpX